MSGYHILGEAKTDRVITIRVKNALSLARGQSALATVASWVPGAGPEFVEAQAYEAIAGKINESLAEQHADAEVRVIDGSAIVPKPHTYFTAAKRTPRLPGMPVETESEVWKFARTYKFGVVAGVGLSGIAGLVWHYFFRQRP